MNIKDLAQELIEAYNEAFKGNTAPLKAMDSPDVVYHMGIRGDVHGADAHEKDILNSLAVFSSVKIDMKFLAGDGNLLAFTFKAEYTLNDKVSAAAAGKIVSEDGLFLYQFKKGKISEVWMHASFKGLEALGMK